MPNLTPGACLFHQDFCFDETWWIHIYHHVLRDRFELRDALPGAFGVVFRVVSEITQDDVQRVLQHDLSNGDFADEAFARSLELVAREDRKPIAACHVRYYAETGIQGSSERVEELRRCYANL